MVEAVNPKEYPKWIDTKTEVAKTKDGKPIYERVLVQDKKEEDKVTSKAGEKLEDKKEDDKKEDTKEPAKEPAKVWPNK